MTRNLLAILICAFSLFLRAQTTQNLLLNPGFETIDTSYTVPFPGDTFDVHNVVGWWNPGAGTTDYFTDGPNYAACGSRYFKKEMKPHSGHGFGGLYLERSKWKEYIGFNLSDTLEAGKNYRFTFWLAISEKSKYGMQSMQFEFWDVPYIKVADINSNYPRSHPKYPPVIVNNTSRASMVSTWTEFTVEFTAVGGEVSVVFGYLVDYWRSISLPETAKNRMNDPYCYYYLDDVQLTTSTGPPIPRKSTVRPIIYFDTDKDVIKKEYFSPLDSVVSKLKSDANMTITVNGYTDSVGNIEDNMDLSRRRAEAVKKYLVDHGIAESRITVAWYAESRPAGEENAENRRVEFVYKP